MSGNVLLASNIPGLILSRSKRSAIQAHKRQQSCWPFRGRSATIAEHLTLLWCIQSLTYILITSSLLINTQPHIAELLLCFTGFEAVGTGCRSVTLALHHPLPHLLELLDDLQKQALSFEQKGLKVGSSCASFMFRCSNLGQFQPKPPNQKLKPQVTLHPQFLVTPLPGVSTPCVMLQQLRP